jgi:hypothetical protein
MDGGKPSIPGSRGVALGCFQIVQKSHDQLLLEIFYGQLVHGLFKPTGSEVQKQLNAVSVGDNGIGAQASLGRQEVLEEGLYKRCDEMICVHVTSPFFNTF